MVQYDNWTIADATRYAEGGTSKALTGPEGARGLKGGRERAKPGESRPTRNRGKHQKHRKAANKGKSPATPRKENQPGETEAKGQPTQRDHQSRQ